MLDVILIFKASVIKVSRSGESHSNSWAHAVLPEYNRIIMVTLPCLRLF